MLYDTFAEIDLALLAANLSWFKIEIKPWENFALSHEANSFQRIIIELPKP